MPQLFNSLLTMMMIMMTVAGNLGSSTCHRRRGISMHINSHRLVRRRGWWCGMGMARGLRQIGGGSYDGLLQGTRTTGHPMVVVVRSGDLGEGKRSEIVQNQRVHHAGHLLESSTSSATRRRMMNRCMLRRKLRRRRMGRQSLMGWRQRWLTVSQKEGNSLTNLTIWDTWSRLLATSCNPTHVAMEL